MEPVTGVHTQNIELYWGKKQEQLQKHEKNKNRIFTRILK